MLYLLQGFIFGIAYVAPIGTQNLFIINTATNNAIKEIIITTLIVVFFDISLALACFIGIGFVFDIIPILKKILLLAGCIFIIVMGVRLLLKKNNLNIHDEKREFSLIGTIASSFSVAWLNPQALIDGTVLFGGLRSSLPADYVNVFLIGVCLASFLWFHLLALFVYKASGKFKFLIKYINIVCGIILIFYGIKLGWAFITSFNSP